MASLKVAISSSSICGKSHLLVDKWVRRISSSNSSSSSSNPTTTNRRSVGVRVLMGMERRNNKGSMAVIGRNGERMGFGWRDGWRLMSCGHIGSAEGKGLGQNWNSFGRKSFSSETKGLASDMVSEKQDDEKKEEQKQLLEEEQNEKLLTLPTILTIGRVAAVPLLISTFYMTSSWATTVTTSIFIAAAITDWLDGYLARKMRLGTAFGAFLDPVADKLMVAATLVLLCTRPLEVAGSGELPWLLPVPAIAIIGREITMSAVREWAASQNGKVLEAVAVNNLGKWKTATQMTALTILLATRDSSLTGAGALVASGVGLLYVSAGLAVWSLFVYMRNIWRVLLK